MIQAGGARRAICDGTVTLSCHWGTLFLNGKKKKNHPPPNLLKALSHENNSMRLVRDAEGLQGHPPGHPPF